MKEIPNQRYNEHTTTATLVNSALNFVPERGLSFADIRIRNRIADAIEKAQDGDIIKLEDADFSALSEIVNNVRWTTRDRCLESFAKLFNL